MTSRQTNFGPFPMDGYISESVAAQTMYHRSLHVDLAWKACSRSQRESMAGWDIKISFPNFWSTAVTTIIISLPLIVQYLCVDIKLIYGVSLWSVSRTAVFVTGAEAKYHIRLRMNYWDENLIHNSISSTSRYLRSILLAHFFLLIKTLSKFSVC